MTPHRGGYVIAFLMLLALHCVFWSGCKGYGAEPPLVTLPIDPSPPPPPPPAATTLSSGQAYAIRAVVPCVVLCSPDGVCEICPRKGPISIDAIFYPSTGPATLVDFAEPYVYLVRPKATATCEIIIVPQKGSIIRRTLNVSVGPAPAPPSPTPTDPLVKALQDAYAAEVDPQKAAKVADLATNFASVPAIRATGIVTKLSQLQQAFQTSDDLIAGKGGLPILRKAISTYIASKMPATDQVMTDLLWQQAADAYGATSKALKGVK